MNTEHHLPTMATVQARIFSLPGRPPFMTVYDLAEFYQKEPKHLNQQVRRNNGRFPEDFIFELTDAEVDRLVAQNAAPNRVNRGVLLGFTKEGALQLSSVLTGPVADAVSVTIIRAFAAMEKRALEETRFLLLKLRTEALRRNSLRMQVIEGVRAGHDFEAIWHMGSASRPRLAAVIADLLELGFIDTPPAGMPARQMELFSHG